MSARQPRRALLSIAVLLTCVLAVLIAQAVRLSQVTSNDAMVLRSRTSVLHRDGLAVLVPSPGKGVWVQAVTVTGSVRTLGVQTWSDGTVHVFGEGASSPARPLDRAGRGIEAPSACSDPAYTLYPTEWTKTYSWYFNALSTPSSIGQGKAASALETAAKNITRANNDCGLPDLVSATNAYKGSTSSIPNISNSSTCLSGDGKSVVGFGTLSSGYVGYTCWWSVGGSTVEADVKLNKVNYAWYVTKPTNCSNQWDVEAVATHEFGHVFGLGHVDPILHANLTMSPVIHPCQNSQDTLGLGDVLGLETKY